MTVKGIELNNLVNIRRTKDVWQGSSTTQSDPEFVSFLAPKWSIRACARILILYQDELGKGTISISEIVNKWAPATENNTSVYIDDLCGWTGFLPTQEIDVTTYAVMSPLVRAMIRQEVGLIDYDQSTIDEGLRLAGVVPPLAPVTRTPALTVPAITAALAAATPALQSAQGVIAASSPFAPALISVAHAAPYVVGIAILVFAGYLIFHELQKRKVQA